VAAPRPFIYSEPPLQAKAGTAYRYEAKAVASIGDVRCRAVEGSLYGAAFWDVEKPRFELVRGPAWLTVDRDTGVVSGMAPADFKSEVDVTLSAETPGVGLHKQTFTLKP
jgi:hypothetical protein